eukprot:gnl/MRDRNA2_/MRDRNA2_41258_c0_seq1.p1 gnl/MRDRNA2_/MRDRNA2_41258_c0~~gnl/MRDRNA2_/MRDRNA2_41258_c0_seq1.p1  ORF type:complete len:489 (+),score=87.07 gnl/MRDRNA2_/MRDRNA2_41258_c0_seq1:166-1632(+)
MVGNLRSMQKRFQVPLQGSRKHHVVEDLQDDEQPAKKAKQVPFCPPFMSPAEMQPVLVAMADVQEKLPAVIDEFGMAIITDCASSKDLDNLENYFEQDLNNLLAMPKANDIAMRPASKATCSKVQCQGLTKQGRQCGIHSGLKGRGGGKYAKPLRNGYKYCDLHMPSDEMADCWDAPSLSKSFPLKGWTLAACSELGSEGRCALRGIPHGKFAWECRLLDNVRTCFEVLHRSTNLVTGLDMPFFLPHCAPSARNNRIWPHVDHNEQFKTNEEPGLSTADWQCYQSVLYIWPATEENASTTVVWPGSHQETYRRIMEDSACPTNTHFVQLSRLSAPVQAELIAEWQVRARRVPVPAGALLIWNSRLIHQGWTGGPRLAQPICWEPRERRSQAAWKRKLRYCALGLPTSHWASLGMMHNAVAGAKLRHMHEVNMQGETMALRPMLSPQPLSPYFEVPQAWHEFGGSQNEEAEGEMALLGVAVRERFKRVL